MNDMWKTKYESYAHRMYETLIDSSRVTFDADGIYYYSDVPCILTVVIDEVNDEIKIIADKTLVDLTNKDSINRFKSTLYKHVESLMAYGGICLINDLIDLIKNRDFIDMDMDTLELNEPTITLTLLSKEVASI